MELFSERLGYKPKKALQIETMDDGLRNRLWSVVRRHLRDTYDIEFSDDQEFIRDELWDRHLRNSIDDLPERIDKRLDAVKQSFRRASWHEVLDLLEFIAQNYPDCEYFEEDEDYVAPTLGRFLEEINRVFEEETSGYRFIQNTISPLTSKDEIEEVEVALDSPAPVALHIQRALELLSDKEQPDYRNSIKESISAVESIGNLIADVKGESLGAVLPQLEKQLGLQLHGALRKALGSLYGWTSDEGGVRHALLEESDLTQEDARFMLIVCSAFVNYLKTKAANAGISLDANV